MKKVEKKGMLKRIATLLAVLGAGYQEVSPGATGVQPRHRRADLHDL